MAKRKRKARKKSNKFSFKRIFKRLRRRFRKYGKLFIIFCVSVLAFFFIKDKISDIGTNRHTITATDYNGIDVSKYQGNIDWNKVSEDSHIQFAYIKASEGSDYFDSKYNKNITQARNAGITVGSYHFFIGRKATKDQFENFTRHVRKKDQDLIPVVDVEEAGNRYISRAQLQRNLQEYMDLVKREYGQYPILYSQYGFYNKMLAPEFNKYYIFIARYGTQKPVLKGNGTYNIWQYSEKGSIKGIKGTVDLNRFANGTTLSDIEL